MLGVIGLGNIGAQVAKIGKAFGMQVVAWSENLNLKKTKDLDILPISKDELIKISDFISEDYSNSLRIISSKHDITGIRVYDKSEITIPNLGLVQLMDNEENKMKLVYTGSKKVRKKYEKYYLN